MEYFIYFSNIQNDLNYSNYFNPKSILDNYDSEIIDKDAQKDVHKFFFRSHR